MDRNITCAFLPTYKCTMPRLINPLNHRMSVITNIVAASVYLSHVPPSYGVMLISPNLAFVNSMACKVFREVKFGHLGLEISVSDPDVQLYSGIQRPDVSMLSKT